MSEEVILVSAGPGDAGLLTCAGHAALLRAETVVHDRLLDPSVLELIPPGAKRIDVGKTAGNHPVPQAQINEILLREAQTGRRVVRLKGGDAYLFGRGAEEAEFLRAHGVSCRVIPGVTSALAAPAMAGIPVTHRDVSSSVHIFTAHKKDGALPDLTAAARLSGTQVFLMGLSVLPELCRGLIDAGLDAQTPAAVVERGATSSQRRYDGTLETLPDAAKNAQSPAIIVVGEVCKLAREHNWYDALPLRGATVVITRPRGRAEALLRQLRELGACALARPVIKTVPAAFGPELAQILARLPAFRTVAFTSAAGVDAFFSQLGAAGLDARALAGVKLAAIGPATARALAAHGLRADLVPEVYDSVHLAALLTDGPVLLPRSNLATDTLPKALDRAGVSYTELTAYETRPLPAAPLPEGKLYITFTSASTVRAFFRAYPALDHARICGVCIGGPTAGEAKKYGIRLLVARQATAEAMTEEILNDYGRSDNPSTPAARV